MGNSRIQSRIEERQGFIRGWLEEHRNHECFTAFKGRLTFFFRGGILSVEAGSREDRYPDRGAPDGRSD